MLLPNNNENFTLIMHLLQAHNNHMITINLKMLQILWLLHT